MRKDLDLYFGYEVSVETRMMPCWFLKPYPGAAKMLATKTPEKGSYFSFKKPKEDHWKYHNASTLDITRRLYVFGPLFNGYKKAIKAPFVDAIGINTYIDYDITREEVDYFSNRDFEAVEHYLARLGLYLEKGEKPIKVVVIRDPKS